MPLGWGVAALLLLMLLMLPAGTQAQSGDGDTNMEPRISCTSHITREESSLTCRLPRGRGDNEDDEDDDDDEGDGIEEMTLCHTDWSTADKARLKCVKDSGDTLHFSETPVIMFNLTVRLRSGVEIKTMVDLKKIVKPRPPVVWNVTFNQEFNNAVIHFRTPYHHDYLKVDNQLFQLHIWNENKKMIHNISEKDHMKIDMEHLMVNTEYHVAVRAIPVNYLRGSWSEWSKTYIFSTHAEPEVQKETYEREEPMYKFLVFLIASVVVVVTFSVFFMKHKIFTYMWPRIPHPKDTLVQICRPNKGLLLNLSPEVCSALKVEKTESEPCEETQPSIGPAATVTSSQMNACSTQSSDCRSTTSVSTEELELSALLSRSSSDGEGSLQSASPSPVDVLQLRGRPHMPESVCGAEANEVEVLGLSQQEEAYVTMSSFNRIK